MTSDDQLLETVVDTVSRCQTSVFALEDRKLAYNIFEQFDSGTPYLTEAWLIELLECGAIDDPCFFVGLAIGSAWRNLIAPQDWSLHEIRNSPALSEIATLCDWFLLHQQRWEEQKRAKGDNH